MQIKIWAITSNELRKIMKLMTTLLSTCLFTNLLTCSIEADITPLQQKMIDDLHFIESTLQTGYAPAEWKKRYSRWDITTAIKEAQDQVLLRPNITVKEFQFIVKKLFQSTKDYHATVSFYSTEFASLPFQIRGAEGRYFFTSIEESRVSKAFPFVRGDELLMINGRPIGRLIDNLRQREVGDNYDKTDLALAEIVATTRVGEEGHLVPRGSVMLTGVKKGVDIPINYSVSWDYDEERVSGLGVCNAQKISETKNNKIEQCGAINKQFILPFYEKLASKYVDGTPAGMLGAKKSLIPYLGDVIWETPEDSQYHAYLFELENGTTAGYVRINKYKTHDVEAASMEFAEIIKYFEQEADVMVIDQLNNPGGALLYVYAIASMLSDEPLVVPRHRIMLTQEDVFSAYGLIPTLENVETEEDARDVFDANLQGMPVSYEFVQALLTYFNFIVDEWDNGHRFTEYTYIYGLSAIPPHPEAQFTKPILFLVNELDFSGGDFLPAILQDNGRAIIFGTRTAGAGGYLQEVTFPNLSGISDFHYTGSIAERPERGPIENHGVTPDILYDLTVEDLQNDYVDYKRAILDILQAI